MSAFSCLVSPSTSSTPSGERTWLERSRQRFSDCVYINRSNYVNMSFQIQVRYWSRTVGAVSRVKGQIRRFLHFSGDQPPLFLAAPSIRPCFSVPRLPFPTHITKIHHKMNGLTTTPPSQPVLTPQSNVPSSNISAADKRGARARMRATRACDRCKG